MLDYLKARLDERSTWLLISGAIATASTLSWPWNLASALVGLIAALVPDGPVKS